ncbi:MAG: hypothetical protein FWF92_06865 [Oscillospiraceae bacterium]|nr:hypothetical protein [Oscillospiraceae bacterium]
MDNPHKNHRSRLKEKYKKDGLDILSFHEKLELILFYSIPRKNTNKIAHELAEKFKDQNGRYSLANIFEASDKMLKEINGISDQTVLYLKLLKDITRQYNLDIANKSTKTIDKAYHENFLIAHFTGKQKEEVVLIALNNRMERISSDVIYVGSVNSTKVDMNKMVRIALDNNASAVIIAHNHPNGPDYPSPEDLNTTGRLERLFTEISINFIDHYVVSDKKISSIKQKNIYGYI